MISFIQNAQVRKIHTHKSRSAVAQNQRKQIINGYEFVWELIKCSKVCCGDCCITTYHEHLRVWRDDPSRSTCYSSIKLEFSSDYPHWRSTGASALFWPLCDRSHKCHEHTYRQIKINLKKAVSVLQEESEIRVINYS